MLDIMLKNEEEVVFLCIKQEIILHNQPNKKDKQEKIRYQNG